MITRISGKVFLLAFILLSGKLYGFSIPVHLAQTAALASISENVGGRDVGFSEIAIEEIGEANEAVDSEVTFSAALFRPERHFTNEEFRRSSERIRNLRTEILDSLRLTRPDGSAAREMLGQALHTVQDFYSHSTWVETGMSTIFSGFGNSLLGDPAVALMPCAVDPNIVVEGAASAPSSAYFRGFTLDRETFGCKADLLPAGKCWHGNYRPTCIGINKDLTREEATSEGVPFNVGHTDANALAREATLEFVQGIIDDLAGNDRALAALLDVPGSFGFAIDDTGSMGSTIAGVRSMVSQIVDVVESSEFVRVTDYVLNRFGDPGVGPVLVTDNASELLSAVQAISPSGGGDCPELSMSGLIGAIDASLDRSRIYLFTDASAKDGSLRNTASTKAFDKNIAVYFVATGSCSPVDPAYYQIASETGGAVYVISPSEVANLFPVIESQLSSDYSLISRERNNVGDNISITFEIPIDSTVSRLASVLTADTLESVVLKSPSGNEYNSTGGNVTVTRFGQSEAHVVSTPEVGIWTVSANVTGGYTFESFGNSPISFLKYEFVEKTGDIHGGFSPVFGKPQRGSNNLAEAVVLGASDTSLNFQLEGLDGSLLDELDFTTGYPFASPKHHLGNVSIPPAPFQVSVTGTDSSGNAVKRTYSGVFSPQDVVVRVSGNRRLVEIAVGDSIDLEFEIESSGVGSEYLVEASDPHGFVQFVVPDRIVISSGETAVVQVRISAAGLPVGTEADITLTATSTVDDTSFNGAVTSVLVVESVQDTDEDGIGDTVDNCPFVFNPDQLDTDGDGTGDVCEESNDADGDGVDDVADFCPATVIPEASVPSSRLLSNRYVLLDGTDFTSSAGQLYTIEETGGCSCEQILSELGGRRASETRYGCRVSTLHQWQHAIGEEDENEEDEDE